ncbi:MAG: tRNA (adenosine(37)-N6)-threonylcarbamoyltransferase complex ATPase subunit type 1 TsaE [Deltaproteobacteria bacterium]|uniref:tRNA threonylcarbamoyladenosine biosynthesis protein TsaE n=1 Tax=Candidatus Zymogenus saltonus TaxID=2844893 RepID=A0A9D8PSD8_9DELT|nr:tRNA (adenosine(37)-N6)-threonylcarbamoyltransferase complex ATPase subunit type 1 TsaE [Candidatus Zymogenus saltonus]
MTSRGGSVTGASERKGDGVVIRTRSAGETVRLGVALGEGIFAAMRGAEDNDTKGGGICLALTGEMGAGKTKLTQGLAVGLGIDEGYRIVSPSFTLINEYPGEVPLYHIDLYRLNVADELIDLGYEEYFYGDGVTVVEWAERADELLPDDRLDISISILGENDREFNVTFSGDTINYKKIAVKLIDFS